MGDPTSDIGFWFGQTANVVQARVRSLVPLALLSFVLMIGMTFLILFPVMLATIVVAIALGGSDGGDLAVIFTMYGGIFLMIPVVTAITGALQHSMYRYVLAVLRGADAPMDQLVPSIGGFFGAMVLTVVTMGAGMAGAMMCLFPAYIIGGLLMFAGVALADRNAGVMDALQTSYTLARPRLVPCVLFSFVLTMLIGVLAQVPIVGVMIAIPVYVVGVSVAYLVVTGEIMPTPKATA